ncbi:Hypp8377 [Branchiostoma lanceolatum]|uniref:Hypp8377 protein n=1 Tax=Branchiostoma lanceolatum TaxID=7740 RepID=A0A8J9Z7X0_BRALA|nr:Hypp8377 [Branchiostoma lanceolatum]
MACYIRKNVKPRNQDQLTDAVTEFWTSQTAQEQCGRYIGHPPVVNLTLETSWHYTANALKVVDAEESPALRLVGWVRQKDKVSVETMARGKVEELTISLVDAYIKKGYSVIKVFINMQ